MEPATETPVGSLPLAEAAARAVTPDPETAALLAKHSAGEPLTQQQYGKIGALASKLKRMWDGKAERGAAVVEAQRQSETDRVEPPAVDPGFVQRTTAAVLDHADTLARRVVGREARKAGADDKTLARFDGAVALPGPTKKLLVETSPDVLAAMGVDPRMYPLTVFFGSLTLWGTNIWLAVDELKSQQKALLKDENKTEGEPA